MSRNSNKALYEQLMQWVPTLKSKRGKPVKSNNIRQPKFTDYSDVKIKNGPRR